MARKSRNFPPAPVFKFAVMRGIHISFGMRWRAIALLSLGANLILAVAWFGAAPPGTSTRIASHALAQGSTNDAVRTNIVVRRQFFSWRELESPDYPTYIANLRDIGCPEQTIRDIIIADVNSLFARRRATELVTPDQQWWRSEPDPYLVQEAVSKAAALEEERRSLLSSLLGSDWETGDLISLPRPNRPGIVLDGPVLGSLPLETKEALQEINARSQERLQEYLEARMREGKNADSSELVKLRQQTREDLARVLAPNELEEYLLRYSQNAAELRTEFGQLKYFNASPDEFRSVFRATDAIDQRIQGISGAEPNSVQARKALEDERENAIKLALGPKRYEEYRNLQDPIYRDALAQAEEAGAPGTAHLIYQVNLAAALEQGNIASNANLTASQKALAQQQAELEQMTANALATGQEVLPDGPPPVPTAPTRRTYTMRPGDNVAVVSLIYGVPVSAIRQANPNINFRRLKPGDVLQIPPATQLPLAVP